MSGLADAFLVERIAARQSLPQIPDPGYLAHDRNRLYHLSKNGETK